MRFAATDKLKGQIKLGFIVLFSSGDGENAIEMGNRLENIADGGTPIYTQELKEKKKPRYLGKQDYCFRSTALCSHTRQINLRLCSDAAWFAECF